MGRQPKVFVLEYRGVDNYDRVIEELSSLRPQNFNFAVDVLDRWAKEEPEKPALLWVDDAGEEQQMSFLQLSERSKQVCSALSALGVRRGDTLVLVLGRQLAWWECFTACLRMGVVVSPGTTQLSPQDLVYRINTAGARAVLTDDDNARKLQGVIADCPNLTVRLALNTQLSGWIDYDTEVAKAAKTFASVNTRADETALCYFTSGTTGYPKMTIHGHEYALGHQVTGKYWLDLNPSDLHWNISDTGWAKAAWSSYFAPWLRGACLFVHDTPAFDPVKTLALLERYPITTFCGAPTIYRMLIQQDLSAHDLSSLRHCVGAGEPLNPEVIEAWRKATGLVIHDGYGQTETTILCGNFPMNELRPGSMGKPAPGVGLQVIDDAGAILPCGVEGNIAVRVKPQRPLGLFKEYLNEPEKTAACFVGDWYLTGDRAYMDEDGYFWFVSRADDVILSAGYRIGPFEVESALIEHPAVAESAVVSSPDPQRGEVVKAFVILAPGFTASEQLAQELKDHVKTVTAPYKYPRKLAFVKQLPKTVSGKIRRIELRKQEWQHETMN